MPPTAGLVEARAGRGAVGLGFGLLLAAHAGGAALGAVGAGWAHDATGGYGEVVVACAALCAVAAASAAAVAETPLWRGRKDPEPEISP